MNEYYVEFKDIKLPDEFYDALIEGMKLPDWCGKNADAIWDMMTGYMPFDSIVYMKGLDRVPKRYERLVNCLLLMFCDMKKKYGPLSIILKNMDKGTVEMDEYKLDFKGASTVSKMYEIIKKGLNLNGAVYDAKSLDRAITEQLDYLN